jgi:glycine cleavage system aminomethyltransferase T
MSPSLRIGIALASVDKEAANLGTVVHIDVRGTPHPGRVTKLPFL